MMQPDLSISDAPARHEGSVACAVNVLFQLTRFRDPKLDVNDILQRSGIAPATFFRLMTNRNDRVSLDVLARACATFRVPISAVLYYWRDDQPFCAAVPNLVTAPITSYGRVAVVLGDVLGGYADIWGEPLHTLHALVGTQRKTIDALLEQQATLVDLRILARLIDVLTVIAHKPHPAAALFASWLQEHGYTPGTTELVLRYIPGHEETH